MERRSLRFHFAIALLGLIVAGLGPALAVAPADRALAGTKKRAIKAVRAVLAKRLEKKGLSNVSVATCKPLRRTAYLCSWRAEGIGAGEIRYQCAGDARLKLTRKLRVKRARIDPCRNVLPDRLPLLPEPGPRPMFGYNEDWYTHSDGLPLLSGLGADVAELNIRWNRVTPLAPWIYEWGAFDRAYDEMRATGIRPLIVLLEAPCWAQPDPAACSAGKNQLRPAPDRYDDLARFARAAARRYPDALGIQVWNEPNWERFWGAEPDPESYARMLGEVAKAVHEGKPGMPVVSAGLAPSSGRRNAAGKIAYDEFLERAYDAGGPQQADAIGTHPYPRGADGRDFTGSIRVQLARVADVMNDHGDGDKPIWVTETGVSTAGAGAYTEQGQAEALVRIYEMFRRLSGIPVVIFHRFYDTPGEGDREAGFGLVRADGLTLKPAYCALARSLAGICP